jgi:archaeosortase A (PGF-CTERM-specific)
MVDQVTAAVMVSSLALLAVGYVLRDRRAYLFQSIGWIAMSGFWAIQTVIYEAGNMSNGLFTALGAAFSLYLSYYAFHAFTIRAESRPLRFIAGMSVIAGAIYYPIEWIPALAGQMIYATAAQTAWALNAVGYNVYAGNIYTSGGNSFVPIMNTNVSIILACTAIQAFALFIAAIIATNAPWRTKAKGLAFSLLIIHFLNIMRNVGIIVLVNDHGVDFDFAHNGLGKGFSLLVLIFILYHLFEMMPSLYDNIMGLFSLDTDLNGKKGVKGRG